MFHYDMRWERSSNFQRKHTNNDENTLVENLFNEGRKDCFKSGDDS